MTEEKAIEAFKANLEKAKNLDYVRNKVAWALYRTWRMADKKGEKVTE